MGDAVAAAVLAQFAALPKTGKPQLHEHTVLAGLALSLPSSGGNSGSGHSGASGQEQPLLQPPQQQLAVVALATGTKCLGASKRLPGGALLNDCHAEVLCRRALLRWLYAELSAALEQHMAGQPPETPVLRLLPPAVDAEDGGGGSSGDSSSTAGALFGGWRCELQSGVGLHLYVSQPPCGDASVLFEGGCQAAAEAGAPAAAEDGGGDAASGGAASGYGRTGAKPLKRPRLGPLVGQAQLAPLEGQQQQQEEDGWRLPQQGEVESYSAAQAAGVVRRKPGRGDATLSMACSDKLARWALLGLQGALLDGLLAAPLHFSSVTVGLLTPPPAREAAPDASGDGLTAAAGAALRRALLERTAALAAERLPAGMQQAAPALHIHAPAADGGGAAELGLAPSATRRVAGGSCILWVAPPSHQFRWRNPPQPGVAPVLSGGAVEAVIGGTGLKAGSARLKAGQPVPPSARSAACKASLFASWQQLTAALWRLPGSAAQQQDAAAAAAALTYRQAKRSAGGRYAAAWARLVQPPSPLDSWIPKPAELEAFTSGPAAT